MVARVRQWSNKTSIFFEETQVLAKYVSSSIDVSVCLILAGVTLKNFFGTEIMILNTTDATCLGGITFLLLYDGTPFDLTGSI